METTTNREGNVTTKTQTQRLVTNMLGAYYRLDTGRSSGRQSAFDNLDWNWGRLQEALENGGYEELDASKTLAARYRKLERRHLLGKDAQ
jgi:hypothetical protein